MWQSVYYEHYEENCLGVYWEEQKVLPYSVKCKDFAEFKSLINRIKRRGYKCVEQIEGQYAVLINTKLKRWCTYPKPVSMSCIDNKTLTVEEFMNIMVTAR